MAFLLLSGLCIATTSPVVVMAESAQRTRTPAACPHADVITEASRRFGIPEHWIRAVRSVESAGDVRAISPAGAMGLMQLMPDTWATLRIRYGLGRDPYDPRDNILAGTAYLREMHDRYGSPGFLAAYNAGPGRYEEYLAGRPLPAETRAYVALLGPLVGGGELAPILPGNSLAAAANPNAWRQSPLFVAPSVGGSDAARPSQMRRGEDAPAATDAHDIAANAPRPGDLFVARTGDGDRP